MSYFADRTFVITYSISNEIDKLREVLERITIFKNDNDDNDDNDDKEHNWFKDQDGFTGLMHASNKGNFEAVQLLLEFKANKIVNAKDNLTGKSALHMAASKGYYDIMKLLLQHDADPNIQQQNGNTPLIWTCANGFKDCTKILLEYGADVNVSNKENWSPTIFCTHNNNIECLKLIIEKADIDIQTNDGYTALHYSSGLSLFECTKLLLEYNARRDLKTQSNKTPLDLVKSDQIKALLDCSNEDLDIMKTDDLHFYKKLCDTNDISNASLREILRKILDDLTEIKKLKL